LDDQDTPTLLQPEGSLPHSQQPTNGPYPMQDEFSPHTHALFL